MEEVHLIYPKGDNNNEASIFARCMAEDILEKGATPETQHVLDIALEALGRLRKGRYQLDIGPVAVDNVFREYMEKKYAMEYEYDRPEYDRQVQEHMERGDINIAWALVQKMWYSHPPTLN